MKTSIRRQYLYWVILPLFVACMVLVPWVSIFEKIYGYEYIDRGVYSDYFLYGTNVLDYKELGGLLSYISNEFLWHYLVAYLTGGLGIDIEYVFGFISVVCLSVFGWITIKHQGPFGLFFLVNPLVIDFAFSQLRLALAVSFLGLAYLLASSRRVVAFGFVVCSLFIQTATIIVRVIYLLLPVVNVLSRRFRDGVWLKFVLLCMIGASISIAVGPMREAILSAMGDRRADYPDMASTLAYSMFWIGLLVAIGGKALLKEEYQQFSVVILSIVAMNVLHGGYSTRFLAASFPFLVSTVLSFRGAFGVVMVLLFAFYAMLQWFYWLRII